MILSTSSLALSALLLVLPSGGGASTRKFNASGQAEVTFSDVEATVGAGTANIQWGATTIKKTGDSGITKATVIIYKDVVRDGKYVSGQDVNLTSCGYDGPEVSQTSLTGGSVSTDLGTDIRCQHTVTLGNGAVLSNDSNLSQYR